MYIKKRVFKVLVINNLFIFYSKNIKKNINYLFLWVKGV